MLSCYQEKTTRVVWEGNKMEKRLYRSKQNRVIAGVCGGLGDYFNIDPTVVRLVFLLSIIFLGVSAWIYLLALIIMPNEPNLY